MEKIRTFFSSFINIFTFVWLFIGSALVFIDNKHIKGYYYFLLMGLVFVIDIVKYFLKRKITHKIKSLECTIEIIFKDILSIKEHSIIIPVNDTFDTELGEIIAPNSIQGQFTQKIYNSDIAKLDELIDKELKVLEGRSIYDCEKKYGKNKRYPLGTSILLGNNPKYILLAVAKMSTHDKKAQPIMINSLWGSISELWSFNRCSNSIDDLYVPIIGTGFGRISSSIINTTKMILLSFYLNSREEKISNKLILVIKSNEQSYLIHELEPFVKALV